MGMASSRQVFDTHRALSVGEKNECNYNLENTDRWASSFGCGFFTTLLGLIVCDSAAGS